MTTIHEPLVYIADLTYNTTVMSIESFPIGIGYIVAYAQKLLPEKFEFVLFKLPENLLDAIDNRPPDLLALSCFPWNHNLDLSITEYFRQCNPDGTVVYGGSNFPLESERSEEPQEYPLFIF